MEHVRGIDTADAHEDNLSENKDNIKPKASGAVNGAILETKRGIDSRDVQNEVLAPPTTTPTQSNHGQQPPTPTPTPI